MRRRSPEPPAGPPEIQFKPGMADELLHELAPLLAEEGIDVGNIDVADPDTLQQALNRAIERHNMAMFTPVGQARELAAVTMRLAAEAIADGDTALAAAILDQAQPESPDGYAATVAGCIGLTLGLLDQWLSGHDTSAPPGLARLTRLPAGHWTGRTRRPRHPHPGPQGTRLRLPRRADRPARRPARPLRQRPRPRRGPPGLVTTRRNPAHRPGAYRHPLKPIRSQPSVASVATMAGIRRPNPPPVVCGRTGPGVPRSRPATELLLSGRTFLTDEAAPFGLIHRVVPDSPGRPGSRRRTELSRFHALLPGLDALLGRGVGEPAGKYWSRTCRKTGSPGAARRNSVMQERSFCASRPPKICSAERPRARRRGGGAFGQPPAEDGMSQVRPGPRPAR